MAGHLAAWKGHAQFEAPITLRPSSRLSFTVHGFVISILNLKVILFVLALLLLFGGPRLGSIERQTLALRAVLIAGALILNTCYALASGTVGACLLTTLGRVVMAIRCRASFASCSESWAQRRVPDSNSGQTYAAARRSRPSR